MARSMYIFCVSDPSYSPFVAYRESRIEVVEGAKRLRRGQRSYNRGDDALSTKPVMHYMGTACLCY